MNVDYANNVMFIGRSKFNLEEIRKYLLDKMPVICTNHKIGSHVVNGSRMFTYDWSSIIDNPIIKQLFTPENLIKNGIQPIR